MLTLLKKAFEMYKAIFCQKKKVLLHISIITVFHSKNAVQAGALIKQACHAHISDVRPKHSLGFQGMTLQTQTLGLPPEITKLLQTANHLKHLCYFYQKYSFQCIQLLKESNFLRQKGRTSLKQRHTQYIGR